jgi:RimJ/RimL family protein N-acetyltransferase
MTSVKPAPMLRTSRLTLRLWHDRDYPEFASLNADPRVMEFFPNTLTRSESDAFVERIRRHFGNHGFGLWALEVTGGAPFIGFVGLVTTRFRARFTPAVEVGWRLAFEHWGHGFATEGAGQALAYGFRELGLPEIVSFTAMNNLRSRAVMERLGMSHDPDDDFDHPALPMGHPLKRHVLYRLKRGN